MWGFGGVFVSEELLERVFAGAPALFDDFTRVVSKLLGHVPGGHEKHGCFVVLFVCEEKPAL